MKKILVTGGAGYVGCVLVKKLLDSGYNVVVFDKMLFTDIGLLSIATNPAVKIINGDIRDNVLLKKSLDEVNIVIHLASISNDPCSDLDPQITREVNYEATVNLVRISKKIGVSRFINVSTSSVYGIKDTPDVTEDLPLAPLTIYSKTKADAEKIVMAENSDKFTIVTIRPATVCGYSPRMRLDLTVNILTAHAIMNKKILVFGGEQKRPNIHIDDIIDYYVKLIEIPKEKIAGKIFNAGYENHKVREIAEIVREIVGVKTELEIVPTEDNRSYHISSKKIKEELGLEPKRTIKDAVMDIKFAFDDGRISDWQDINLYNVKKMKSIGVTFC